MDQLVPPDGRGGRQLTGCLPILGLIFVMLSMICIFDRPFSCRTLVDAAQLAELAHVLCEVLHPDLGLGLNQVNGAH